MQPETPRRRATRVNTHGDETDVAPVLSERSPTKTTLLGRGQNAPKVGEEDFEGSGEKGSGWSVVVDVWRCPVKDRANGKVDTSQSSSEPKW